jgi:hypothetical protein
MGIDIYAHWKGQSADETEVQTRQWLSISSGCTGYLREAYHGEPYATRYLCAEAFETDNGAQIGAAVLRERLPHTLVLAEERARSIYNSDANEIEEVKQSFRDFVALCEKKEQETGEPVRIIASY